MSHSKSWEDIRDLLRNWREDNARRSDEIIELWESVLSRHSYKLKDELWMVYEQVCIAALDCHRMDIAEECVDALNIQFPNSLRVRNLRAMQFEAIERYEDAVKLYDSIISQDESNLLARKRKVAILKSQNKIADAIKELVDYLKKFMSDQEAWMELSDLYIMEQDYNKAAFCIEELIIFNPHNHLYHQRYAEIRYTQGGIENVEIARAYFSQAAKLNPNNIRALYGILLCANNIASSVKCPAPKKKENMKYASWASKQLQEKHAKKVDAEDLQYHAVLGMLASMQFTN